MKKQILIILAAGLLLFTACHNADKSISGIYIANSKNEYTILSDTLVIEAFNLESNTYHVEKRSGYNLIREGKVLPKEFKLKTWTATYDKEKQVLQETEYGRQIYVNQDAGTVKFGATYQKIK